MSKKGKHQLEGYFDYVVPPLEGLWWQEGVCGVDYAHKKDFQWISLIRLPEFATEEVFHWAIREATEKKQRDFSKVEFSLGRRDCVCSACTSALMTTSRPPWPLWKNIRRTRAVQRISEKTDFTMKSI